jgi:hypothetical protein
MYSAAKSSCANQKHGANHERDELALFGAAAIVLLIGNLGVRTFPSKGK